jgi:hypothetical protein
MQILLQRVLLACTVAALVAPAFAAVPDVSRHVGKVAWLSKQPQRDAVTCQASCKSMRRAAAALPCSNNVSSAENAAANQAARDCPCLCCRAWDNLEEQVSVCSLATSDETAWCRRQRHQCEDECGGTEHTDFM